MKEFMLKNKNAILYVLFCSFFFSLVLLHNAINSKVIIIIAIFSIFSFDWSKLKNHFQKHYPLAILFSLIILSLLYSNDMSLGLKKAERLSVIPISIILFSCLNLNRDFIWNILKGFVIIVLIAMLYSHTTLIIDFINNDETSIRTFFKLNYSYQALGNTINLHSTYYSFYILTAIIIVFELLKKSQNFWPKVILVFILAYSSFFIFHLSSRTSIIVLYILILFNIIHYAYNAKKFLKGILLIVFSHLLIYITVMNIGVTKYRFQHIFGFTYYTGYTVNDGSHKMNLWNAAIKANDNFIFGTGIGDIQSALNASYKDDKLEKPFKKNYNSHNQYIEYYVAMGILGLSSFVFLICFYLRKFYIFKNGLGFQFVICVALLCVTECIWNRHNGIVHACFMLVFLTKLNYRKSLT